MFVRAASLCVSLGCGAAFSQFPEFSQQYIQRLGGAVDELAIVVRDFDASAKAEGLSRDQALEQLVGTGFLERRRTDMIRSFDRFEKLSSDLFHLETANQFQRVFQLSRFTDRDIARRAWAVFVPAVPLSLAGISFALAGFAAAMLSIITARRFWRAARAPT